MEDTAFKYVILFPAFLTVVAVWIVIGSIGARIAARHHRTRSARECPQCQNKLQSVRRGFRHRVAETVFLVDISCYACIQCGFRHSIWQAEPVEQDTSLSETRLQPRQGERESA